MASKKNPGIAPDCASCEAMLATEWGTDYWGEILSEPSEEHARKVGRVGAAKVYSRSLSGEWVAA